MRKIYINYLQIIIFNLIFSYVVIYPTFEYFFVYFATGVREDTQKILLLKSLMFLIFAW